jgi:hypothetical protein
MYQDTIGIYRVIAIEQEQAAQHAERARQVAENATFVARDRGWTRMLRAFGPRRVASSRRTRAGNRGDCPDAERTLAGA